MKVRGILVATAALGLLAAAPALASHHEDGESADDGVKCAGINGCAGKGECAAADGSNDCSGKNSCKGKGWVHTDSAKECTDQGGTVQE